MHWGRAYTARAVAIVRESAAVAGREPLDIVQYLPCAARPDGAEAREIAKEAVDAMLIALWPTGNDWPAQRETIVRLSGIARPEMVGALDRLRRGERAGRVLDDRFISGFALAGTAEQVIAQAVQYRRAGADELALSFAGPPPGRCKNAHRRARLCASERKKRLARGRPTVSTCGTSTTPTSLAR